MLAKVVYKYLFNERIVPYLEILSQFCLFLGLFWLCIVNFVFSRNFFVSENAFVLTPGQSFVVTQNSIYVPFINYTFQELQRFHSDTKLQEDSARRLDGLEYVLRKTREMGLETYTQDFPVYTGDSRKVTGRNIYTYVRAKRSSQKDCLLVAYRHGIDQYNISYHLGVSNVNAVKSPRYSEIVTAITMMKYLSTQSWLSRDVIFLGYDGEFQYGTAVRSFLREYYFGSDSQFVRGGIIRQGIAVDFKSDDFNKYALQFGIIISCPRLHVEGNNGKLSDMDIVSIATDVVSKTQAGFTFDDVGFFRSNVGVQRFDRVYRQIVEASSNFFRRAAVALGIKVSVASHIDVTTTLDFWRNMILGRSGDAHSHMMEYLGKRPSCVATGCRRSH